MRSLGQLRRFQNFFTSFIHFLYIKISKYKIIYFISARKIMIDSNKLKQRKSDLLEMLNNSIQSCSDIILQSQLGYEAPEMEAEFRAGCLVCNLAVIDEVRAMESLKQLVTSLPELSKQTVEQFTSAVRLGNFTLAAEVATTPRCSEDFEAAMKSWIERSDCHYSNIFDAVSQDPEITRRMSFGEVRPGHPEGSIDAHISELNKNLLAVVESLKDGSNGPMLKQYQISAMYILITCHDTFKGDATPGVSIMDPRSHASLARSYLAQHTSDTSLLEMIQRHDEPFALFKKWQQAGKLSEERMTSLFKAIKDWDTFILFQIIDNTTLGKTPSDGTCSTGWLIDRASEAGLVSRDYKAIQDFVRQQLS